ncbi:MULTISPECIES: leucine zipper domain-containing protein [Paenarthrobacter]|uniref:Leucine zipper domain-containing protein n=1 Tax=Paenarthrobacter ureafaciens TaxID=37931 RepID=A0AAX3ERD3_PAEUR|nr:MULTISPECIES: leucine zipper domain-containing protein [Paenarthrobacter]NKR13236.1 hypothetical protein [Arthrobacter sp. M5]NKR14914.1 hypothetical protein [Arthrobacter sp. M6]OEH62462.1 hypothetical protein A5N13_02065 [Arthrobacter sp. D4]OEH63033.1 hypothetical protein A5N17_10305 [Arthrobacter sp. D2]MDO5865218.1 hypothetical protein [Paenarthrobacter sp. SD-2]
MSHADAVLTPKGRLRLARCIVEDRWPLARSAVEQSFNRFMQWRGVATGTTSSRSPTGPASPSTHA